MKPVYVFLATGFEEIEALTVIDILRRAAIPVETVSVDKTNYVEGAHGITVLADTSIANIDGTPENISAIILPGGIPGADNLELSQELLKLITSVAEREDILLAAICAAPFVYGHLGLLKGIRATCYPGYEDELHGAIVEDKDVIVDGKFITARGAGVSGDFAFAIVERLVSKEKAAELRTKMCYK